MKIETRFDIGQEVWFINNHYGQKRVERGKILNVRIFALGSKLQINYRISDSSCGWYDKHSYRERQLFITKEEAEQELRRLQGKG